VLGAYILLLTHAKPGKCAVILLCVRGILLCVRGIYFASFYDFSIRFWNCSDGMVLFGFPFYYMVNIQQRDGELLSFFLRRKLDIVITNWGKIIMRKD